MGSIIGFLILVVLIYCCCFRAPVDDDSDPYYEPEPEPVKRTIGLEKQEETLVLTRLRHKKKALMNNASLPMNKARLPAGLYIAT